MGRTKRQHVGASKLEPKTCPQCKGFLPPNERELEEEATMIDLEAHKMVQEHITKFAEAISGCTIIKYDPASEYTFTYTDLGFDKPSQIIVYNEYGEFHTEWTFKRTLVSDKTEALQQILDAIASGRYQ